MIIYCTEEGTRTPTLKADAPKASVATITPPRHFIKRLVVIDFIRNLALPTP